MNTKEKIIDEEIVGKYFKQNCGDTLLVLNESIKEKRKPRKFKCQFQNRFCEVLALKSNILKGKVINPQIEIDEFMSKEWPQHCGDSLKVLRKTEEKISGGIALFEAEFQKYPCKVKKTKAEIKNGNCVNPRIEEEEFIGKIFPQNCGDSLKVLRKTNIKKTNGKEYLFEAEFQKYPYKINKPKSDIKLGTCVNPRIEEEEFMKKEWPQNCGDILIILEKIYKLDKKGIKYLYFRCKFKIYECEVIAGKEDIKLKKVWNPEIENQTFIGHEFLQHCGDTLIVLEKTDQRARNGKGNFLFRCKFKEYECEILATKQEIKNGTVINLEKERIEFFEKEWNQPYGEMVILTGNVKKENGKTLYEIQYKNNFYKDWKPKHDIINGKCYNPKLKEVKEEEFLLGKYIQRCGDTLKIIKRTDKKCISNHKTGELGGYLYECEFENYPCKVLKPKNQILAGSCDNPNLPWKTKEGLLKVIKENFKDAKPTYQDLANYFNLSKKPIRNNIIKFNLKKYIKLFENKEEESFRKYIQSIYTGKIITYFNKYEIDVYLPELKIGFEYNGFRWHEEGNPDNPYGKPIGYHENKKQYFKSLGIDIYYIWDYEWYKDNKHKIINESCKEKVKNIIFGENNNP